MNILYIIPTLSKAAGMERVLINKVNYLVDNYDCNIVILLYNNNGEESAFDIDPRVQCIEVDAPLDVSLLKNPLKWFANNYKLLKTVNKLLVEKAIDVCISLCQSEIFILPFISRSVRKVIEYHFSYYSWSNLGLPMSFKHRLLNKVEMFIFKNIDSFIVLTKEDLDYWKRFLSNASFIPNPARKYTDSVCSLTSKKVISVGRFCNQKGFDRLIEAWSKVESKHRDWQLVIVGSGELKSSYENQIKMLNVNNISLVEPTSDVINLMLNSSIYVLSSRFEGMPMVMLEAMSVGLPIVAFRCPCGPSDLIDHGLNGVLVKENDISDLAESILLLIENPSLRDKISAESLVRIQDYSESIIMNIWFDFLKNNYES